MPEIAFGVTIPKHSWQPKESIHLSLITILTAKVSPQTPYNDWFPCDFLVLPNKCQGSTSKMTLIFSCHFPSYLFFTRRPTIRRYAIFVNERKKENINTEWLCYETEGLYFESRYRQDFFLCFRTFRPPLGQHSLLFNGYRGSFVGLQLPESEVNYSPPSSAEVTNEWSPIFTSPWRLHGLELTRLPEFQKPTPFLPHRTKTGSKQLNTITESKREW